MLSTLDELGVSGYFELGLRSVISLFSSSLIITDGPIDMGLLNKSAILCDTIDEKVYWLRLVFQLSSHRFKTQLL